MNDLGYIISHILIAIIVLIPALYLKPLAAKVKILSDNLEHDVLNIVQALLITFGIIYGLAFPLASLLVNDLLPFLSSF
jgi:hypothetical protein